MTQAKPLENKLRYTIVKPMVAALPITIKEKKVNDQKEKNDTDR